MSDPAAVRAWFPTLVYQAPLRRSGGAAFARELLEECHKLRDHDDAGRRWSKKNYPGGYTSYASMAKLQRTSSTFMALEKALDRHVRVFAQRLDMDVDVGGGRASGGRSLAMTDCWLNIMPRHAVHSLHLHPLATVSGTYYVKTPRGSAGIRFEDPRLPRFMAAPPKIDGCRPENRQQVTYAVEAGQVVLFESWLRHEVRQSTIDRERVSISFNYNWF